MKYLKYFLTLTTVISLTACTSATAQSPSEVPQKQAQSKEVAQAITTPSTVPTIEPSSNPGGQWKVYNDGINYDYLIHYPPQLKISTGSNGTTFSPSLNKDDPDYYSVNISRYRITGDADNELHGYEQARDRYMNAPYTGSKLLTIDNHKTVYYRAYIDNPASDGYQIFVDQQTPTGTERYVFSIGISAQKRETLDKNNSTLDRIVSSFRFISKGFK